VDFYFSYFMLANLLSFSRFIIKLAGLGPVVQDLDSKSQLKNIIDFMFTTHIILELLNFAKLKYLQMIKLKA
jgi:hypothetical protein